jgi:hypothetical protein
MYCHIAIITTNNVVVLIPPAVEPGPEPMNIIIEYVLIVAVDSAFRSIVAKPAFLVDIVLNAIATSLSVVVPRSPYGEMLSIPRNDDSAFCRYAIHSNEYDRPSPITDTDRYVIIETFVKSENLNLSPFHLALR